MIKRKTAPAALKLFALLLALLLAAAPAAAFADDGDGATYNIPEDSEDGKMYILGNPDTSASDPVLTTGAETSENQPDSKDATSGLSEEELARRKEIYTMVTLIAMAAILVGLREKRNRR